MKKQALNILLLFFTVTVVAQKQSTLTIDFEGIKSFKGKLFVALYNSKDNFLKEGIQEAEVILNNGDAAMTFKSLEQGIYAVSAFYDKNNNGKLDTNFFGIPKEPIAISNNVKGHYGPPKFKDARFTIAEDHKNIKISF